MQRTSRDSSVGIVTRPQTRKPQSRSSIADSGERRYFSPKGADPAVGSSNLLFKGN